MLIKIDEYDFKSILQDYDCYDLTDEEWKYIFDAFDRYEGAIELDSLKDLFTQRGRDEIAWCFGFDNWEDYEIVRSEK